MKAYILLLVLLISWFAAAQSPQNDRPLEIDFLLNYYDQDGKHSAVTGGSGTEELSDHAGKIIVNVPLDSSSSLEVAVGLNYYTSASSDNINSNVSSASSDDFRGEWHIGYQQSDPQTHRSRGFHFSGSSETDYISLGAGLNWAISSADQNRWFQIAVSGFADTWMPIFPDELRRDAGNLISTYRRYTSAFSFNYMQVLRKRLQLSLSTELIYQNGLLSTPFHRIYFSDFSGSGLERLPDERTKFPFAMRLHYFWGDHFVFRLNYRFYIDSFDISAQTIGLEVPLKFSRVLSLHPFYRYHTQAGARYFREFGLHSIDNRYGTSDYDLSEFYSHKRGVGLRYAPLYGITAIGLPFTKAGLQLSRMQIRYANYEREDGLKANTVSLHLGWIVN